MEDLRIKRAKERIKEYENLMARSNNPKYITKIEEERKKIRQLQAKDMEKLDFE